MHTNRINNISLFVTVLSACLGLLTLGLPPQAYASAGQSLNVAGSDGQDGGAPCNAIQLEEIARDKFASIGIDVVLVSDFIGLLHILNDEENKLTGRFDMVILAERSKGGGLLLSSEFKSPQKIGNRGISRIPRLASESYLVADEYSLGINGASRVQPSPVRFEFRLDETEFYASVSYNQSSVERAQKYADAVNQQLSYRSCLGEASAVDLEYLLYRNARAVANGSQIRIVTRLPRASIDALNESPSPAN